MSTTNQLSGGGFQDPLGNVLSFGFLIFSISQDAQVNSTTQIVGGYKVKILLDINGNVASSPAQSIWPNDVLSPSGTFYNVSAYNENGQLVWGPNPQQVLSTPSPFDVGAWVPTSVNIGAGGGSGSLSTVSVVTANGVSGTAVTTGSNAAITLSLAGFLALNNTWTGTAEFNNSVVFEAGAQANAGLTSLGLLQTSVTTPATSSANFAAPDIQLSSSYWTGTAAATDSWALVPQLGVGANPQSVLNLSHSGSSGTAIFNIPYQTDISSLIIGGTANLNGQTNLQFATVATGLDLITASQATAIANVSSSTLSLSGSFWNGTNAVADFWNLKSVMGTGINPTTTLTLTHGTGTTGIATFHVPNLNLDSVTTTTTATAGSGTLPSAPLGFWETIINGTTVKIPYYSV